MIDVGVDIGVRKIALGCVNHIFSDSIKMSASSSRNAELLTLTGWLRQRITAHTFLLPGEIRLWVEQPFKSNGPKANQTTTIAMAEVVGAILSAAHWSRVTMVGQSTWKAQVCGNGRCDKDQVTAWLAYHHSDLLGLCNGNQDQIDAMCIGMYGMMRSDGTIGPPEPKKRKSRMRGQNPRLAIMDEV